MLFLSLKKGQFSHLRKVSPKNTSKMIHNLSNIVAENNFDTFYKATIIEASQLPDFNYLSPKDTILTVLNSLPPSAQAMVVPFLLESLSLSSSTQIKNGNKHYSTSLSFPLVPQDAAMQELLESYNNRLVVAFITRHTHSQLYGTQAQPLVFTFDELHAQNPTGLKGYTLRMSGDGYGPPLYFAGSETDFPIVQRGLAFQLSGSL